MSIDDINHMKQTCIKQSYTFLIDSSDRDRSLFPTPSEYNIEFTIPFKNVIGLEVLDVSIPKTMYNIDNNNNLLYYHFLDEDTLSIPIITDENGEECYDYNLFNVLEIPPGDYNTNTFIDKMRLLFFANTIDMDVSAADYPPELTNKIFFQSNRPFILDMHRSTIAEVLGFDEYTNDSIENAKKYRYNDQYNAKNGFQKLYHSIVTESNIYRLEAPGMMYLIGHKYIVLKCPEIEQHLYRSLSYSKYNLGLAKIRVNSYGYNDEKTSFLKVPLREFHPIGKLSKLTFRFETKYGTLYDFKGVNHNIIFGIYYYEPKQENIVTKSILNPEYNPDLIGYLYTQQEQEGESDEEIENFSRDNIDQYKKREMEYNRIGIEHANKEIALTENMNFELKENQKRKITNKLRLANFQQISSDEEEEEDEDSEED